MDNLLPAIGQSLIQLLICLVFSFLIGLEIYIKTEKDKRDMLFGSERTFAFISLLGFILLKSQAIVPFIYVVGFIVVTAFLLLYYYNKEKAGSPGITIIITCLLVYSFPLVVQIFPAWFAMLIIAAIMVLIEIKSNIKTFAEKLYTDDFITLAKFVVLSFVILPLVPDRQIILGSPVSPYKLWLAIVAISSISYVSYILRKFVFPRAGLMLTGILGGLYSSTATTFILAKKSREKTDAPAHYAAAIIIATMLMFVRIYVLVVIFNPALSIHLLPYFLALIIISAAVSFFIYRSNPANPDDHIAEDITHQNPLELRVALIFGILYIAFSLATQYTLTYFGGKGLNILSLIVGFTDIDPFLLNLFQGKYAGITLAAISAASLQAVASNNILKMAYALSLGDKSIRRYILVGFSIIIVCNILVVFLI
ncbi:MAG: MgtC/SapB family protein [Flavipsychrobacter sp.]